MIIISRLRFVALALLILVGVPSSGRAQGPCADQTLPAVSTGREPFTKLAVLTLSGCLGGPQDNAAVNTDVRAILRTTPIDPAPFKRKVTTALARVSTHLADAVQAQPQPAAALEDAARQVGLAAVLLDSGVSPAVPAAWTLDAGRVPALSTPLQPDLDAACATGASAACRSRFELTKELLRVSGVTKSILDYYVRPIIKQHQAATAIRYAQWDEYFGTARSQYPWELFLNGALMKDSRPEEDGVRLGFRDVPKSQVILLHPYVAFEYAEDEPEGNRFAGVVLVDAIGYNRWSWKPDGSMGFALGASAILVMGDHANMDDVGWGAMLHVNHKWSVGMTFLGDTKTIVVSGDVAQLWTSVSAARKKKAMTGQ